MSLRSRLRGTIGSLFQLGLGGPQLKNTAGAIEVRNATDAAYAIARAASPVGNSDLATKGYVDTHGGSGSGAGDDIRSYGEWSSDPADALINMATLQAAYDAMAAAYGGTILLPPYTVTLTPAVATRVAVNEGACLRMNHATGVPISFVGTPGATVLKPASNKIEMFTKETDFDLSFDGVIFDNADNGVLELQLKTIPRIPNTGIVGHGNGANCAVRQYSGDGVVTFLRCRFHEFCICVEHIGDHTTNQVRRGDIVMRDVEMTDHAFGLLAAQPYSILRDHVHGRDWVDSRNGRNTDGTTAIPYDAAGHPTTDTTDPGHTIYVNDRGGLNPLHQQHSNIKATGGSELGSSEKLRKGDAIAFTNYSFSGSARGLELHTCHKAVLSNINGNLAIEGANNSGIELTDAGFSSLDNIVVDVSAVSAWGLRVRGSYFGVVVSSITLGATPTVTTATAHGFTDGMTVSFYGCEGMTEINDLSATVVSHTSTTFVIDIDTTLFAAYTASTGHTTNRPWTNRCNRVSNMTVLQDHSVGHDFSAFIVNDQDDMVLVNPTQVHLGNNPGRTTVDLRNCKRALIIMPKKIAPNAPQYAERLVYMDANCEDCTIILDDSCLSVPFNTGFTVVDDGVNNRVIRMHGGPFLAAGGTEAAPTYTYAAEPSTGFYRSGTGTVRYSGAGTASLAFLSNSLRPVVHEATALGSTVLSFGRSYIQSIGLTDGVSAPTAVSGRAMLYVDSADHQLKFRTDDSVIHVVTTTGVTTAVSAMNVDWDLSDTFTKTLAAGANTFTFSNATTGQTVYIEVTGAASTLAWSVSGLHWDGGVVPTQTASGTDLYAFTRMGTITHGRRVVTNSS